MEIIVPVGYLPPLYFFQLIKDKTVVFDVHENFIKQTYRNRCAIHDANGRLDLIIPLDRTGSRRVMKEVRMNHGEHWQKTHWKSLEAAYKSSPYFEYYEDYFHPFYEKKFDFLVDFNMQIFDIVCKLLKLKVDYRLSSEYIELPENEDYRLLISPKKEPLFPENSVEEYYQVFALKNGFIPHLSIADALFNKGPRALELI